MKSMYKAVRKSGILIIVENLPVPNDRRVWLEATTLQKAGYEVSIISITGTNATAKRETLEDINIYRYPAPPATSGTISFILEFVYCWVATLFLAIVIKARHGFKIIHACNPPETFWLIGWIFKPLGVKFVFDHHDLSPEMYASRFGKKGIAYRLLVLLEKFTFATADIVITTNETHKNVALTRGNMPEDRVFIVRSGPDHNRLSPSPPVAEIKRGHSYVIAYLGVLNPQDGVDSLVMIADIIVNLHHRSDILFIIMGSGDSLDELNQMATDLGIDEHVVFTGWADIDLINQVLGTSDICVDTMPKNSYSDGCTLNKVLEYMSAGKPIVAFDLVETRVSARDSALYVTPDNLAEFSDTLLALLADTKKRMEMAAIGRHRIETSLSWSHQSSNLLSAYRMLC